MLVYVKNKGLGGLVSQDAFVAVYNDSGCLVAVSEYHSPYEAKRGFLRAYEKLSRNPDIDAHKFRLLGKRTCQHPFNGYESALDYDWTEQA